MGGFSLEGGRTAAEREGKVRGWWGKKCVEGCREEGCWIGLKGGRVWEKDEGGDEKEGRGWMEAKLLWKQRSMFLGQR